MIVLKILLFPIKLVFKACVWLLVAVEDSASSKPQKDEKIKPSSIKDKLAKGESKKTEATKAKAEIAKESASKTKEAVIA